MPKKRRASKSPASSDDKDDFSLSNDLLHKVEDNIHRKRAKKCDKAVREGQKTFRELVTRRLQDVRGADMKGGRLKDLEEEHAAVRKDMYAAFCKRYLAGRENLVRSFDRLKELDAAVQTALGEVFTELDKVGKYKQTTTDCRAKIIENERSAKSLHKAIEDGTAGPIKPIVHDPSKPNPVQRATADVGAFKSGHPNKRKKPRTTDQTLVNSD